ncbi:30S ribosomal protein S12 methylthiotransferase RimO [Candidatus Methylacidithermus pantelleriae]|uniref:Ribosomal protein uS12 methylthiotransferase RimO n=1 Tax=Candidatus Methylacidithermus pantelleriae TaxID=2744239 RepID=A0A8J2FTA9_9BACT|nr:30S ribosomal protein S12 methylthiotransferase RimO [Candidatus Methylacidithermus pantelleriae]CAF0702409.1 Ribosomal protein S12 methylthiotransferase RimO [Candidatus Methylacidithermus pantelleriae]
MTPRLCGVSFSLLSLGCAKNLVDSEVMMGTLLDQGACLVEDPKSADVLIINTCCFVDEAKEESIETILQAHQARSTQGGNPQKIVVAGCLSQRFPQELPALLPEIDAFIGLDEVPRIADRVAELLEREKSPSTPPMNWVSPRSRYVPDFDAPRFRLTPKHYAYVKIAEGCNHPCTFCILPQVRGRYRSRTIASIVTEARNLVAQGVRELNLISQDTTYFGQDRRQEGFSESLADLLEALSQIPGDFWVRLLYTHPAHWSDRLIDTLARCPKIARYADIPFQHISDPVLQRMQRGTSESYLRELLQKIRTALPGIVLRTTFIVGFPGETEEDFEKLLEFIREARFERLGVFRYSAEEGTRAAKLPDQIPEPVKRKRRSKLLAAQQETYRQIQTRMLGATLRVLVEDGRWARSEGDAPEVDTRICLTRKAPPGEFVWARLVGIRGYDFWGEPL